MKQVADKFTSEIFGNRPGRPRKLNAKPPAQRSREYRLRQKQESISVTRHGNDGIYVVGQLGRKD
jgi:hypothetical protein